MVNVNKDNMIQNIEKSRRIIKYILMGLIILVAVRYIPTQPIETCETVMVALISSISFGILDMVSPSIKIS